uniref:Uncharacterized protein n=1 Tax=Melopsittacus undulatus TaxID=13146 RepID=A0A8C6NCU2_MELUD
MLCLGWMDYVFCPKAKSLSPVLHTPLGCGMCLSSGQAVLGFVACCSGSSSYVYSTLSSSAESWYH